MRNLHFLLLNHNVEWRGTFQRCYDFAKVLISEGHQVTIVTNSPTAKFRFEEYDYEGIRIIRSPDLLWGILRTGWDPVNVIRRYWYLRNRKFDLIHAFDNRPTVILPALWLSRAWKCPLVSDWCDWWGKGGAITLRKNKILNALFEPIETFFEEHYRKYAKRMTVISTRLKDRAVKLGFPEDRIELIPPLANIDKIFPINKLDARKRLELARYPQILLFGGFVLYDFEMVLNAFRIVRKEFPSCLLVLTGGVTEKHLSEYRDLSVLNIGFVSPEKYQDYLAASDLCLLPLSDCLANQARFPHKIGHYTSCGRPIVTNPIGDGADLIRRHDIGYLTEPNPEAFANGICEALRNPTLMEEKGRRARAVAEEYLSGRAYKNKLSGFYSSCLEG